MKDPWFAVNLSWTLGGLGQFYAGRRKSGAAFLAADVLYVVLLAAWLVTPHVGTLVMISLFLLALGFRIVSSVHALRAVRAASPPSEPGKNPWRAFFFARFIPGLGHAYAGKWGRAILFFGIMVAASAVNVPQLSPAGVPVVEITVGLLALLDAFMVLRRRNVVPRRATIAALTVVALVSQSYFVGKFLQFTVAEAYKIPASSMEPTLMGPLSIQHPREDCSHGPYHVNIGGDHILASKVAYLAGPVERFDVVAFRFPLNQSRSFVKRVVGLPDEELLIHRGDLYFRPKGEKRFRIARKSLETQDAIWISPTGRNGVLDDVNAFSRIWETTSKFVIENGQITTSYPGEARFTSTIREAYDGPVGDLHVEFQFRLPSEGQAFAEVANSHGTFEAVVGARAGAYLGWTSTSGDVKRMALKSGMPAAGKEYALALSVFDGRAVVRIDGREEAELTFVEFLEDARKAEGRAGTVSFGIRDARTTIRKLKSGRDIYYRGREDRNHGLPEDEPTAIPSGHYMMFGDNVSNSHDSRAWTRRTFVLKDGRRVECEGQEVDNYRQMPPEAVMEQLGLKERPDTVIAADSHGVSWALYSEDPGGLRPGIPAGVVAREEERAPLRFVDGKFISGRVNRIWWPPGRIGEVR